MGLFENDVNHPVFGNIKQALETLVQQRLVLPDGMNHVFAVPLSATTDFSVQSLSSHTYSFNFVDICRRTK